MVSGRSETQPFHSSSEKTCNFSLVRIIPQTRTRNILWIGQLSFRWNGFYSKVNPMANFGVTYWFGQERKWVTSLLLSSGCHQIKFPGVWLYPLISRSGCTSKELHPVSSVDPRIRHQQVTLTHEKNLHFQESQTNNRVCTLCYVSSISRTEFSCWWLTVYLNSINKEIIYVTWSKESGEVILEKTSYSSSHHVVLGVEDSVGNFSNMLTHVSTMPAMLIENQQTSLHITNIVAGFLAAGQVLIDVLSQDYQAIYMTH